jgi:N6-adenosine-specific RNA methylase IME4
VDAVTEPYRVILADPPWSFKSWSDKGKNRAPDAMVRQKGLAERHYATMDKASICGLLGDLQLPIAKDATLLLWAVDCMLPEALEVMAAWGFRFKTVAFTWAKTNRCSPGYSIGLGYWTRGNPEMCLLGTRGSPKRLSAAVRQLIVSERREHSRKPDEAHERIETLLEGPYMELFARERRPGWDSWGNQLPEIGVAA